MIEHPTITPSIAGHIIPSHGTTGVLKAALDEWQSGKRNSEPQAWQQCFWDGCLRRVDQIRALVLIGRASL